MASSSALRMSEKIARDEITQRLTFGNRLTKVHSPFLLQLQIAGEYFRDIFADQQLVQFLKVGQALEKQNAVDQPVGMLHLVNRLVIFV